MSWGHTHVSGFVFSWTPLILQPYQSPSFCLPHSHLSYDLDSWKPIAFPTLSMFIFISGPLLMLFTQFWTFFFFFLTYHHPSSASCDQCWPFFSIKYNFLLKLSANPLRL